MLSIESIGYYVPETRLNNLERCSQFGWDPAFVEAKIGVRQVAVAEPEGGVLEIAAKAFADLQHRCPVKIDQVEALIVVTQTARESIPHLSARLHGRLGLRTTCACFDLSLGCSGYVYGLMVLRAMMEAQGMSSGLLFTASRYSKIVQPDDRNTALLFGDAASATLLSHNGDWGIGKVTCNTMGSSCQELETRDGKLYMNGRSIFTFSAQQVPVDIRQTLKLNNFGMEDIDFFAIHQGSRFILDTIRQRLGVAEEKMPFVAGDYGNTVSSSIPIILADRIGNPSLRQILVSGFGVGLSWASTVLSRRNGNEAA